MPEEVGGGLADGRGPVPEGPGKGRTVPDAGVRADDEGSGEASAAGRAVLVRGTTMN